MKDYKRDIPQLRFEEFTENWHKFRIEQISKVVTSGSRGWAGYYSDKGAKFIRMTNLDRNNIQLQLSDLKYVLLPTHSSEGQRTALEKGDILISITAELGKIGIVPDRLGEAYINQHICLVRPNTTNVFPCFLALSLSTYESHKRLNRLNDSGAKSGLNLGSIKNFLIELPHISEQEKIAGFLDAIASHLSQLRRKHNLLQTYKRGVMQKIFSQQIRFKQDDGSSFPDWEGKVLSKIFTESCIKGSGGDKAKKITVKLWGRGVFSKEGKGSENTQYYIRKAGQFIYSKLDFLNCAFGVIPSELDGFESTIDLPCFDISKGYSPQFLLPRIMQKNFYKYFGDQADGSRKAKRIHADTFLSFKLQCPCLEEQEKIAGFLTTLDQKLENLEMQIERVEKFKQGLLQKMFV